MASGAATGYVILRSVLHASAVARARERRAIFTPLIIYLFSVFYFAKWSVLGGRRRRRRWFVVRRVRPGVRLRAGRSIAPRRQGA